MRLDRFSVGLDIVGEDGDAGSKARKDVRLSGDCVDGVSSASFRSREFLALGTAGAVPLTGSSVVLPGRSSSDSEPGVGDLGAAGGGATGRAGRS